MCLLFETIKIENGNFRNLRYHAERMNHARITLLNSATPIDLGNILSIPGNCKTGVFKCRIDYNDYIHKIEITIYIIRKIETLKLVVDDEISYQFKYIDRSRLEEMKINSATDDILVVKNGFITDTSFSNIIFFDKQKWLTPAYPLLKGTKRQLLIDEMKIFEEEITPGEFKYFTKAKLINAMLEMDDDTEIELKNILF